MDSDRARMSRYGVPWGTCRSPFPFQVWCQRPNAWSIKYSYGTFPVRLQDAEGGLKPSAEDQTKGNDSKSSLALVLVLCAVGGCALLQFCRTFCRKRLWMGQ